MDEIVYRLTYCSRNYIELYIGIMKETYEAYIFYSKTQDVNRSINIGQLELNLLSAYA